MRSLPWLILAFLELINLLSSAISFNLGMVGLIVLGVIHGCIAIAFGIAGIVMLYKAFNALRKPRNKRTWQEIGNKVINVVGFTLTALLYSSVFVLFVLLLYCTA
jgi:hypothetical protein